MGTQEGSEAPTEEEIKGFVQRYADEYRRFLDEKYPERRDEFPLYTGYPYHVTAYVDKRGTLIEYQLNASEFKIAVKIVEKKPEYEKRDGYLATLYANRYLKRIIDEPEKMARRDITDIFAYEEFQKEEEEYWEKWHERYVQEDIHSTVQGYISYIKPAYNVQEKTCSTMKNEIYTIMKNIQNQYGIMECYFKSDCLTIFDILSEVIEDIQSSLFLATHGKYGPALALLRRWLETFLVALYFDAETKKYGKGSRTYNAVAEKRDKWVEKARGRVNFTGEYGILERLIDPDTDYVAGETLRRTTHFKKSSFRSYVAELYQELSKFVHYGGARPIGESLSLEFAEYNEGSFKEWCMRFNQIYEICNLVTIIKFPEILPLYNETQEKLNPEDQVALLTHEQIQAMKRIIGARAAQATGFNFSIR